MGGAFMLLKTIARATPWRKFTASSSDSQPSLLRQGRVTHEVEGRCEDGSVPKAVDGQEAARGGSHPALPAAPAAHPPHQ